MEQFKCELCNTCFKRKGNLMDHKRRKKSCINFEHNYVCKDCDKPYPSRSGYKYHMTICPHIKKQPIVEPIIEPIAEPIVEQIIEPIVEPIIKEIKDQFTECKNLIIQSSNKYNDIIKNYNITITSALDIIEELKDRIRTLETTNTKTIINNNYTPNIFNIIHTNDITTLQNYDYNNKNKYSNTATIDNDKYKIRFIIKMLNICKNNLLVEFLSNYIIFCYNTNIVSLKSLSITNTKQKMFMEQFMPNDAFWNNNVDINIITYIVNHLFVTIMKYSKITYYNNNLNLYKYCNELCYYLSNKQLSLKILNFISSK